MRVISRRPLRDFWNIHRLAETPLTAWFRVLEAAEVPDFHALRKVFPSADYVAPYTVFDVGGNRFRVIAVIHYNRRRIYVRHVLTHAEYDKWSDQVRRAGRSGR